MAGTAWTPPRLALNFKSVSFKTTWVEFPDVEATRKRLGVPPSRKFPDGSDFYTLPVFFDAAAQQHVGDSFDIALYLDVRWPDGSRLVSAGTAGVLKAWNDRVDALFSRFVKLCAHGIMPLNPDNAEASRRIFVGRGQSMQPWAGGPLLTWDDCTVRGDARSAMLADFQAALGELDAYYAYAGGAGPFLAEDQPTYSDLIVGGWLGYVYETLPPGELADLETWHHGCWAKVWKALARYADCTH